MGLVKVNGEGASCSIADAAFPEPFRTGVEYAAPARGTWNIVHTGMLIPESHQIFVCAQGCLRGVILTAAELGEAGMDRFSTIAVQENNVLDGDMEKLIVEGVTDILGKLPVMPKAVLVYTSCVHHFIGCDLKLVYRRLRERFPQVDFTDCYMNPIMRKKTSPDVTMRRQLYSLLKEAPKNPRAINILGNDFPTNPTSELVQIIKNCGFTLTEIMDCKTYEEYQKMAEASLNITYYPAAQAAGKRLQARFGTEWLHLPFSYNYEEIKVNLMILCGTLGVDYPMEMGEQLQQKAEEALTHAREIVADMPIAIDYTACPRPLGMARLLIEHGFCVDRVYVDSIAVEDRPDFDWLKTNAPELMLYATAQEKMAVLPRTAAADVNGRLLAIGQKAAYFTGTRYFVNLVEGSGTYGFDGIVQLSRMMEEAAEQEKDTKKIIQVKGWGCCV